MPRSDLCPIFVRDLGDPRLAPFANQSDAWLRAKHNPRRIDGPPDALSAHGLFMGEGTLVVEQLIASKFAVESVLVSADRLQGVGSMLLGLDPEVPIYVMDQPAMESLVGFAIHRGLLACARRGTPIPPARILAHARTLVVMEDLTNHDNVGGIFRSLAALASGSSGVLLSDRTCDPLYRKALRVSMGHVLRVPFGEMPEWHREGVRTLRDADFTTIALTPDASALDLRDLQIGRARAVALLVGSEGPGLRRRTLEQADLRVRIPMSPGVDSLNVGVAAAVVLYALAARHHGSSHNPLV